MSEALYNALDDPTLQRDPNSPHCIRATAIVQERAGDQHVIVDLPLHELQQARKGKGQRKTLGFQLTAEVSLADGRRLTLRAPWVAMTKSR